MCDFKPGDEVVCVEGVDPLVTGATYTVDYAGPGNLVRHRVYVSVVGITDSNGTPAMWWPSRFRKVQKRNDRLTIEAFSIIKDGGFEEPKREPAKTPERVS